MTPDELALEIIYIMLASAVSGAGALIVGLKQSNKNLCKRLDKLSNDVVAIKRCFIIQSKLIDDEVKTQHPDAAFELEKIVKEMLEDK